jgi:hypothetical protein
MPKANRVIARYFDPGDNERKNGIADKNNDLQFSP